MRRSASRRFAVLAFCLPFALSLAAACTLFNPLDEYGPGKPKHDAGADTAVDTGPIDECAKTAFPERPAKDDGDGELELVFALRTLAVPDARDAGPPSLTSGVNLDGVCTCPGPPSCAPPPDASPACDHGRGIDTGGNDLIVSLARLGRFDTGESQQRLDSGSNGLLFRIAYYNGGLDDSQVEFSVFLSHGTETDDAGTSKPPVHDGNDRWTVDKDSLIGGAAPPYVPRVLVDPDAYISGGVLVTKVALPLQLGQIPMKLGGSVTTMKVVRDGASFRLDEGRLVGRWATRNLLTALDQLQDPFVSGGALCGDSGLYTDLKRRICQAVDIAADPNRDKTEAACDALSVTVLFTAEPAQLGAVVPSDVPEHKCGADWSDDCPH